VSSPGLGYLRDTQLSVATALNTVAFGRSVQGYGSVAIYVIGAGTITGGTVMIETADYAQASEQAGYGGTWSPVLPVPAVNVTGNAQQMIVLPPAPYSYVRTRVSSAITGGGSVSTTLLAT
jgi:hypothetical protein